MVEDVSFRNRKACLSPVDLEVFAAALVEEFPTARYLVDPHNSRCEGPTPPPVATALRLTDLTDYIRYMHFDEDWVPQWGKEPERGHWSLGFPRLP